MVLKSGDTFFPKSNIVPCNLAWANIPKIGITTAVIMNPKVTQIQSSPALYPKSGGNNKLPAPKKSEKSANAVTKVSLEVFIGMCVQIQL